MENDLLGIGAMASLSGLSVSALRFYDGAGVLAPALVDPRSGYRYYRGHQVAQARLVAHLRRVSLPVEEIRAVLTDPAGARAIVDAHLARLELGLADARREISIVHHLLENPETTMHRLTLPALDLTRALREVRYAVCADPEERRLHGVYLDSEPGRLRVVATDRYRLATSAVVTDGDTGLHVLLPAPAVDEFLTRHFTGTVEVVVADGTITLTGDAGEVRAAVPDVDFPPYRTLLPSPRREVPVDAAALRAAVDAGETSTLTRESDGVDYAVTRLSITDDGVRVGAAGDPDALVVAVNQEFLLQALATGGQLTLGLDDPIAPLAIRDADRDGVLSVLMPVRLDESA